MYCTQNTLIDYLSCNLNHDELFASDCVKHLVNNMLLPLGIHTVSIWIDMANHFIGREMTATLLHTLPKDYQLKCEVNRFVEHHGKSPVDAHFSHLTRWITEAESTDVIVSTTQLINKLMERAASHAKGRTGADDDDKVSNVRFVEYRPACTHAPMSCFIDTATSVEADVHNEDVANLHYVHQPIPSKPVDVETTFSETSQPIVYDHNDRTSHLTNTMTNSSTSLLEQIERSHACTTPERKRKFMEIEDHRLYYSFSASPPAGPNDPVDIKAQVIANNKWEPKSVKYKLITEEKQQALKFAPRLPQHTVISADKRAIARMRKRDALYRSSTAYRLEAAALHSSRLFQAAAADPTSRLSQILAARAAVRDSDVVMQNVSNTDDDINMIIDNEDNPLDARDAAYIQGDIMDTDC
jgi:hypothetical protein